VGKNCSLLPTSSQFVPTTFRVFSQIRPDIPEIYGIFGQEKYHSDEIALQLRHFLAFPSLNQLFQLVLDEVTRWEFFVGMDTFSSQQKELLHLDVAQISADRFPSEQATFFVPHSLICRLFYFVQLRQPTNGSSSPTFSVALYFSELRKLPDFLRNLANEIVTRCTLATVDWVISYKNSLFVRNTSNNTYDSAVRQLSNDFGFPLAQFKELLVDPVSPVSDSFLMNIIMNKIHQKRWGGSRATTAICGLKNIGSANSCDRFTGAVWANFEKVCKKMCPTSATPLLHKNLSQNFAFRIYNAALKFGSVKHQEVLRFIFLTGQRARDYEYFQACAILWLWQFVQLFFRWSKTRQRHSTLQWVKMGYGTPGTFFDIRDCLETLVRILPANETFLLRVVDSSGHKISHGELLRCYAKKVPVMFHSLQLPNLSMHCVKYLMSNLLSKMKGVHPQVTSHYLRHSTKSPEFRTMIQQIYPQFAAQWFSPTSLRYVLTNDNLPAISKEFQRIWDECCTSFEQSEAMLLLREGLGEQQEITPE
tara:strand:- start:107 stop:1708 length:1602 start_codon:yes stop_codon:yes gene_type:complete